ncbi:hypothetical protein [Rhodoferax sp. GW822-FHT02A01]|uniref:hypothetical protein n=1 Tax=Rhodoferax sp. GW822-FHT02A01 TaxID=3141537 RepID=UPI00315CEFE4
MDIQIPAISGIRTQLAGLSHAQVQQLAIASGVPFTTLWKIRDGTTSNPGIETVRLFFPHIAAFTVPELKDPEGASAVQGA